MMVFQILALAGCAGLIIGYATVVLYLAHREDERKKNEPD